MDHNPRIEDLRRRVDKDPASIAFAQLAEEYRRSGDLEEAIRVCEAGLAQHPAYISARVTLGRALFDLGRLDAARVEFRRVVEAAPDNLTARGKLVEIDQHASISHPGPPERRGAPVAPASVDPVLSELQMWLDVIGERRLARRS